MGHHQIDEQHAEQGDDRPTDNSMPPVMMTNAWPMAKSPNSPTRLAVLPRLIGDRNKGLMSATTVPTTRMR